jgi:hypothetical protein
MSQSKAFGGHCGVYESVTVEGVGIFKRSLEVMPYTDRRRTSISVVLRRLRCEYSFIYFIILF